MIYQVLLALALTSNIGCKNVNDKKPAVIDWEQNNFGIRTAHTEGHEDLLNNVNIDRNAPQIPKRLKSLRHQPRRKVTQSSITRNKLKIRSRIDSKTNSDDKPNKIEKTNQDQSKNDSGSSIRKDLRTSVRQKSSGINKKEENVRYARFRYK